MSELTNKKKIRRFKVLTLPTLGVPDSIYYLRVGNSIEEWVSDSNGNLVQQGAGGGTDKNFVHVQGLPSDTWTINHNLNKFPSVTIVDSANTEVIGEVEHVDLNNVILKFSGAFSGRAFFN